MWSLGSGSHVSSKGPEHVISCLLTDIPAPTPVHWNPATPDEDLYSMQDGFYNGRSQSQVSTLTVSNREIAIMLGERDETKVTFTCEITVGKNRTPVRATQLLTIHESEC